MGVLTALGLLLLIGVVSFVLGGVHLLQRYLDKRNLKLL